MSDGPGFAYLLLMLILPLSALAARRLPLGSMAKMALGWVAIFAVLILAVGNWERVAPAFRALGDTLGISDQSVSGDTVRIRKGEDGHFWANVVVNGVERRMLIDSGATTTAISTDTATAAGIDLDEDAFNTLIDTANGTISARRATGKTIDIGGIHARDIGVVVSPAFGDTNVIGMNFLSRLKSWRVEGNVLVLQPKGGLVSDSDALSPNSI
ncbi:retropepsin-like aspartic protease family protein [Sphingomonas hylomeconis]|uniref:TIGR02281 family clan AA aspartic protease n=1 Tax=Sphingomonas hylomeconis TaxID=1395958 RepID=A0ABV7SYM2_9SPHN|nr:TIGR02281 family clan AA aspartic protease [Sphingomonas hylomeconis]